MADRAAKLRRLETFRRKLPHISQTALHSVLDEVQRSGVPETHSRRSVYRAREEDAHQLTPYGPLHQDCHLDMLVGPPSPLRICHPLAFLWLVYTTCPAFARFIDARHAAAPSTAAHPWSLCLYTDEVTPGNPLTVAPSRKIQVVYWSLLEFGAEALCREDLWFLCTQKRSGIVNKAKGNLAQLVGTTVKSFFCCDAANVTEFGLTLPRPAGRDPLLLYIRMQVFVQDGSAHKFTWHCKGDGGTKFCLLCKNVFTEKSKLIDEDGTALLKCCVIKRRDLRLASSAELRFAVRRMEAHRGLDDPTTFIMRCQALGFVFHPYNMLSDPLLTSIIAPREQFMHDWMHCIFVGGVWNHIILLFMQEMTNIGIEPYQLFMDYLEKWRWPMRLKMRHVHEIFEPKRREGNNKAKYFKCTASEGFTVYNVIAHFVHSVFIGNAPDGICTNACYTYLALSDVIDCLTLANRGLVTSDALNTSVEKFLALVVDTWGNDYVVPKFHWLLHFGDHLDTFGTLISCFVHERKHRGVKRFATDVRNTRNLEASVLHECTAQHIALLRDESSGVCDFRVGLIHPTDAKKKVVDFLMLELNLSDMDVEKIQVAERSRFAPHSVCSSRDVALIQLDHNCQDVRAGEVWVNAEINSVPISVVSLWRLSCIDRAKGFAVWDCADEEVMVIPTDDIVETVIYTRTGESVRTLLPRNFC